MFHFLPKITEFSATWQCCQRGTTLFFCFVTAQREMCFLWFAYCKTFSYGLQIPENISSIKIKLLCMPELWAKIYFCGHLCIDQVWLFFFPMVQQGQINEKQLSSLWRLFVMNFCLSLPLVQKYRSVNFIVPSIRALRREWKYFRDQGETECGKELDKGPLTMLFWFQFLYQLSHDHEWYKKRQIFPFLSSFLHGNKKT